MLWQVGFLLPAISDTDEDFSKDNENERSSPHKKK
jgi:hypothetical protein